MKPKQILTILLLCMVFLQASGFQRKRFTVSGTVTDENGSPLAGAAIAVVNSQIGTFSGSDGSYLIALTTPGTFRLRFTYTGYEPLVREISVQDTLIVNAVMNPGLARMEEVIVSATRAGARTPMTYSGLSDEEIKKSNTARDMPFLMGLTPSLVETSEAGTGIGYTSFRIRGTDASRINITLDGIPLNDPESQQVFWVDLPDLASSIDNIQVQRGVGTSSNGAGAFGASVNMQAKSPENLPFGEISATAGSFRTLKNTIAAGTGLMADKFAFQFRYSGVRSDGYIKRTGADNKSYAVTGIYKTGRSFLKINMLTGVEHTGISWWGVPAEVLKADRRFNPAGEYTDENGNVKYYDNESDNYTQTHYQLIYGLGLNKYMNFHTALHYTRGEGYYEEYREDQPYSDYGLPDVSVDSVTLTSTDLIRRKWMKNDFYGMVWSLGYRKNRIDATAGGGMNYYGGNHFGKIIWMRNAGNTEKDFQWYLNKAGKGEFNVYGKVNYRLNEKLSAYGDLQYRHIFYKMKGPDDDLKDITQSHYFDFFNPKAGVFMTLRPGHEAYISFSVAHKEPTRSDFKDASGDAGATPKAETLFDAEAGYMIKTSAGTVGANLYGMFYNDQLVPTGQLSNVGYPIMTNVKTSYRAGIEITAELRLFDRMDWKLSSTLSSNKIKGFREYYTEYMSDGTSGYFEKYIGTTTIAYSPAFIASSDLGYSFGDRINIHFISKYVGKQYFDNTMSDARSIDHYFVNNLGIDLNVPVKKIKAIEFGFQAINIFNNLYESNAYGGFWFENRAEKTWAYYFPQAGINFLLSASIKF